MSNFDYKFEQFKTDKESGIEGYGKTLGKGAYGEVREVKLFNSNKLMAGKLIKKKNGKEDNEIGIATDVKGNNIIKVVKALSKQINDEEYELIIMEKAILRDLGKLNDFYFKHNLLKVITDPFHEKVGDNLLRFYVKQIVNGLEILDRMYLVHFDIKPENILITFNLNAKISDFSLATKIKDGEKIKIPGGTPGFLSLEYYISQDEVTSEVARKQDYFALGATIFFIKYGENLFKFQKYDDREMNANKIVDLLHIQISKIEAGETTDQEFINFIKSLIFYTPEQRPNFENIYRNSWLNKNSEVLEDIAASNENDEEKVIMELQKSDFLLDKKKDIKQNLKKFRFKKKINTL